MLWLFAACWPWIPGEWEDYDVPDTTRVIGYVDWSDYVGDYWGGDNTVGTALWGWMDPATEHTASSLLYVAEGCETEPADLEWFVEGLTDVDSETSTLLGEPQIDLEWSNRSQWFEADLGDEEEPAGTYSLAEFEQDGVAYSATDALVMPAPVDFDMDVFDGKEPPTLAVADLIHREWSAREGDGIYVNASLYIVTGSNAEEVLRCGAPLEAGEIDLKLDEVEGFKEADYVALGMTVYRETAVRLEGSEHASHFVGGRTSFGAAYLE